MKCSSRRTRLPRASQRTLRRPARQDEELRGQLERFPWRRHYDECLGDLQQALLPLQRRPHRADPPRLPAQWALLRRALLLRRRMRRAVARLSVRYVVGEPARHATRRAWFGQRILQAAGPPRSLLPLAWRQAPTHARCRS
eukprot:6017490-Prymnesium_polylepis.1